MPGYRAHLAGALLFWGIALALVTFLGWYAPDLRNGLLLLALVFAGALFPDTDTDSVGRVLFYCTAAALDLVLMYLGHFQWAAVLGFCAILPGVTHHRGWTHSWWAALAVPLPILILPSVPLGFDGQWVGLVPYYGAVVVGYVSHLVLDRFF